MPIKRKGIFDWNNGMKDYWTVANKKPRPVLLPSFHSSTISKNLNQKKEKKSHENKNVQDKTKFKQKNDFSPEQSGYERY
jgi:hypothetical protein